MIAWGLYRLTYRGKRSFWSNIETPLRSRRTLWSFSHLPILGDTYFSKIELNIGHDGKAMATETIIMIMCTSNLNSLTRQMDLTVHGTSLIHPPPHPPPLPLPSPTLPTHESFNDFKTHVIERRRLCFCSSHMQ